MSPKDIVLFPVAFNTLLTNKSFPVSAQSIISCAASRPPPIIARVVSSQGASAKLAGLVSKEYWAACSSCVAESARGFESSGASGWNLSYSACNSSSSNFRFGLMFWFFINFGVSYFSSVISETLTITQSLLL